MDLWQVIAEPRRRRLVELCWDGERSVNDLHAAMEDISLGAVSQHLGRLREAGLVQVRADGRWRWYRADREHFEALRLPLEAMWTASLDRLGALARDGDAEREKGKPTP
ncbi:MAG TPA: metalloregulator ArsR/SmtB family transcription factor [Actinomycetota bacterium]|nr:metalloregulator ArsR/SmtB family transcription factor [Actinomycetota bacterium]